MPMMSSCEVRELETLQIDLEIAHSKVEVGAGYHGLCQWFAMHFIYFAGSWVIVDQLTMSTHFIPIQISFTIKRLYCIYVGEIDHLRGVHIYLILNRGSVFISRFQRAFQEDLVLRQILVVFFIPKHMDSQSGLFSFSRICSEHVFYILKVSESNTQLLQSLSIIIVIRVLTWRLLRLCILCSIIL